jgi:putative copper resistance protein D
VIFGHLLIVLAQAMRAVPGMEDMPGMDHGADATLAAIFDMLVFARWLHFASVFTLFGSSIFWLTAGRRAKGPLIYDWPWARRMTAGVMAFAAPLALFSGLAWLAGMLANMTGGFDQAANLENIRLFFFETAFGPVWEIRLGLLAAAAVTAISPLRITIKFIILSLTGALLLINQAWLGHAAEGGGGLYGTLMIAVYCIHMGATGAWAGGLLPLVLISFELKQAGPGTPRQECYAILARYSTMASIAVTLVILSGIATAWFRTAGSLGILVQTSYGTVLFAKIILVTMMLALAGYNRFAAMPSLRRGAPAQGLRLSVLIELGLGILVLAAAAVLGITPPPQ